tara:strand:- start:983 stop:2248 length:1266 start_codon:yes stop_codon:yes gene_type:complete
MNSGKIIDNICFCIPARFESTRLPNKLMLPFDGISCIKKTVIQVLKSKYFNNNLYVLLDNQILKDELQGLNCKTIMTKGTYKNGSERISKNIDKIDSAYKIIVNIQADEPYISEKNIDYCIQQHISNNYKDLFYSTLHEIDNTLEYIKSTASLKMITDLNNNVLYYSRNIIPWNKNGVIDMSYTYKTFTGIYVYNRYMLDKYSDMIDTPLQIMEDCEQLKILENGYSIKSYPTIEFNEISLNTKRDYEFLLDKYCNKNIKKSKTYSKTKKIKFVVFDLDGVFTDGKIYILENEQMKCYNGKDSYGLKLLNQNGYKTGLITAHDSKVVDNMEHIVSRMDYISKGSYKKINVLEKWKQELNLDYDEIAYIGDDIPDLEIIKTVGFSSCPNNAVDEIKKNVNYICKNKGGNGAVREFCEYIISN